MQRALAVELQVHGTTSGRVLRRIVPRRGEPVVPANSAQLDPDPERMRRVRQHRLQIVLFGPKSPLSIYKALLLAPDALEVNNVPAMVDMVKTTR